MLASSRNNAAQAESQIKILRQLDHFALPRLVQENHYDDKVYLIQLNTALTPDKGEDAKPVRTLRQWLMANKAALQQSLAKPPRLSEVGTPQFASLHKHSSSTSKGSASCRPPTDPFYRSDSALTPLTKCTSIVSSGSQQSLKSGAFAIARTFTNNWSAAAGDAVKEHPVRGASPADPVVRSNIGECRPETLFSNERVWKSVTSDYIE